MSTEVLMQFMKNNLIDLQGSDEKLAKLEQTSSAISDILKESPSKALAYIYTAIDPNIAENNIVIQEIINILDENWPTYFNAFKGTPIQVIRALLLQGLSNQFDSNLNIAIAFDAITRNLIPHTNTAKEKVIWFSIIHENSIKINQQAEQAWSAPEKITIEPFSYSPPKSINISSKEVKLDREALQTGIEKASGPANSNSQATGGNQHYPNNGQHWVFQFTPILTTSIADVVDEALEEAKIEPIDLSKPLKGLSEAVENHINNTLDKISTSTSGLQKRTSLIWWKESLYSPSANCSYRDIPLFESGAMMAYDMFTQVPTLSPASVTAFLRETVASIEPTKKPKTMTVYEIMANLKQSVHATALVEYIRTTFNNLEDRGTIISLLSISDNSAMPDENRFLELTGVDADLALSNCEWAIWVFRELQAIDALLSKGDADE